MAYEPDYRDAKTAEQDGYDDAVKEFKNKAKAMRARYRRKISLMQEEIDRLNKEIAKLKKKK